MLLSSAAEIKHCGLSLRQRTTTKDNYYSMHCPCLDLPCYSFQALKGLDLKGIKTRSALLVTQR